MKSKFSVSVSSFTLLDEIDGTWQETDFRNLLTEMDFGDVAAIDAADLRDMCIMSLQDLEPAQAAAILLRYKLGDKLNSGQIDNVSHEMLDEKMWEEYVDEGLHEQMFVVGGLLYSAFPNIFPTPDAVQVRLEVTALSDEATDILQQPENESFVVRLLADGMDATTTLRRVFSAELEGDTFAKADTLIWIVRAHGAEPSKAIIDVISSGYWLDALRDTKSFTSSAFPDEV